MNIIKNVISSDYSVKSTGYSEIGVQAYVRCSLEEIIKQLEKDPLFDPEYTILNVILYNEELGYYSDEVSYSEAIQHPEYDYGVIISGPVCIAREAS